MAGISVAFRLLAFRLQFPYPDPPDMPPISPVERLIACTLLVWMTVALLSMILPRPWFVALFKIAFPWAPDRLEDIDDHHR